jgi:PKHD-type hydroxylase
VGKEMMITNPLYWSWKKEIPESVCDAIIEEGKKLEFKYGVIDKDKLDKNIRNSQIGWFSKNQWVAGIMRHYIEIANFQAWNFRLSTIQDPQFTIYNKGGFYGFHQDSSLHQDGMRKLSCVITIAKPEDFEGGEFEFEDGTVPDIKERGSVLVFPSFISHRVSPVTSGTRYSLVAWHEGPKFL